MVMLKEILKTTFKLFKDLPEVCDRHNGHVEDETSSACGIFLYGKTEEGTKIVVIILK